MQVGLKKSRFITGAFENINNNFRVRKQIVDLLAKIEVALLQKMASFETA